MATAIHLCLYGPQSAAFFAVSPIITTRCRRLKSGSSSSPSPSIVSLTAKASTLDEDIVKQLERAKAVLAVTKAKMEARDAKMGELTNNDDASAAKTHKGTLGTDVPFFASANGKSTAANINGKKEKVIKSKNEDTGLFTTDGDLMAKLSEGEEWQPRRLLDVFSNEEERLAPENHPLANRDVAASIYNLRRVLQTEDYMRIFDKRNRFIGDP